MTENRGVPVLAADSDGNLLDEKQLRALAMYINDPNTSYKARRKRQKPRSSIEQAIRDVMRD